MIMTPHYLSNNSNNAIMMHANIFKTQSNYPATTIHPPSTKAAQKHKLHQIPLGNNILASLQMTQVLANI
jgi:hypothetical protein